MKKGNKEVLTFEDEELKEEKVVEEENKDEEIKKVVSEIKPLKVKKKKTGAKKMSLFGMIFGAVWIVVWSSLKFTILHNVRMQDIIYSGLAVGGIFAPVTLSIILDKIKGIKFGDK